MTSLCNPESWIWIQSSSFAWLLRATSVILQQYNAELNRFSRSVLYVFVLWWLVGDNSRYLECASSVSATWVSHWTSWRSSIKSVIYAQKMVIVVHDQPACWLREVLNKPKICLLSGAIIRQTLQKIIHHLYWVPNAITWSLRWQKHTMSSLQKIAVSKLSKIWRSFALLSQVWGSVMLSQMRAMTELNSSVVFSQLPFSSSTVRVYKSSMSLLLRVVYLLT